MDKGFDGKVVLITGSSRGIGRATAELAYQRGATVILHGRSESAQLKDIATKLNNALYVICDIAEREHVKNEVEKVIQQFGRIDVLINCAGDVLGKAFLEDSDTDWLDDYRVNTLGVVHFCQAIIPHMQKKSYGRIVNVASIRGHEVTSSNRVMSYSAAKAATVNLTAALAKEFAPDIAVNGVSPGFVNTDNTKKWNETVWNQKKQLL